MQGEIVRKEHLREAPKCSHSEKYGNIPRCVLLMAQVHKDSFSNNVADDMADGDQKYEKIGRFLVKFE